MTAREFYDVRANAAIASTRRQHGEPAATTTDRDLRRATPTSDAIEWEFQRVGLCTLGERALILSAAQRMIEHRHTARDAATYDATQWEPSYPRVGATQPQHEERESDGHRTKC